MARRAKFGRRPSVQANIGGTLIAIAREMQARRDQNIMDAWKNGGEFEGKKVTDDMAQAYWQGRLKNLDKQDPAYDTIRTQIMQLEYGIEQSKMDLRYVQGKIDDAQYAQFFLKWSNKVPKNGEFWRVLQKDAARLMEAAKERSRINGEKAKQEAFNKFVEDKNKDISVGTALTAAINRLSQETGLNVTGNGDRLLELLSEDYRKDPDRYHALRDAIKDGGEDFSGTFTHSWVATQVGASEQAYDAVAVRARKDGYASAYDAATKGQADMSSWASNMEVWSVAKSYDRAYAAFARVWDDPTASYRDKQSAAAIFSGVVSGLAQTKGIDSATQVMLKADAARALGEDAGDSPSFGMAQLGHKGITPEVQQVVAVQREAQALMDQNPGQYVYASMSQDGTFDPTGKSPVGIVAAGSVPPDVRFVAVPGLDGKPSMVAVKPHSIFVQDPNDPKASPIEVGRYISYQVGGRTVQMFGYQDEKGNARWTLRSPYADGVQGKTDKDGSMILTLPGAGNPAARAAQIDQKYGTNLSAQMETIKAGGEASAVYYNRDKDGKVTAKVTVKFDGTSFTATQSQYAIDPTTGKVTEGNTTSVPISVNDPLDIAKAVLAPTRLTGADVPGTYTSPLASSVAATIQAMSSGQVAALAQDPAFQHAFVTQTMETLGINNPLDQRVADAWNQVTSKANGPGSAAFERGHHSGAAFDRTDLDYPGAKPADVTKTTGTIGFAGQELKLPGLPAYLNSLNGGQPPVIDLNSVSNFLGGGPTFGQSLLQVGQAVGQAAAAIAGSTAPAAPGSNTTIKPVTPPAPSTVTMPAPSPVAASAPPVGGYGGGGATKNKAL